MIFVVDCDISKHVNNNKKDIAKNANPPSILLQPSCILPYMPPLLPSSLPSRTNVTQRGVARKTGANSFLPSATICHLSFYWSLIRAGETRHSKPRVLLVCASCGKRLYRGAALVRHTRVDHGRGWLLCCT